MSETDRFFSKDFFTNNRLALQKAVDARLIALTANGLLQRSGDTTFPFRQDSNFWYLTGIDQPDYVLVIAEKETFLISPKRAEHRDLWDGEIDSKQLQSVSGIDIIYEHHEGWLHFDKLIKKVKKVHTVAPAEVYFEHFGFYANPSRWQFLQLVRKHRSAEIIDIRKVIARLRQVKQASEVRVLKKAIAVTSEALLEVRKKLSDYRYEYEIVADISASFIRKGAGGHAYQPIVASAEHAHTIHYISGNSKIKPGFLLIDVGAEFCNYSADISRTFFIGQPTKRHEEIYKSVLHVQQAALDLLTPGQDMKIYEKSVDEVMAKELKKLGLIDDIKDRKKLKKYYPHLTSHFLGLDTHDAADYEQPLPAGAVVTVEPGIYIPEEGIGVRIEDDVLITSRGPEILSATLPKDL